jgi:uncharacterized protein YihD (DUF1040 family)
MRDPNRIPEMLQALGLVWMRNPDLRLTQLVSNAASLGGYTGDTDKFYCEDDVTFKGLIEAAKVQDDEKRY